MEKKSSGCCGAPKKRGLSFSIEEILKRPAERSDAVRPEGAGGQATGQAAAADSRPERPPQDQPQGKCLLAISHLLRGLLDPAALRQRESSSISTEAKPSEFKEMLGTGLVALNTLLPSPGLGLFQLWTKARFIAGCRDLGLVPVTRPQLRVIIYLFSIYSVVGTVPEAVHVSSLTSVEKHNYHNLTDVETHL